MVSNMLINSLREINIELKAHSTWQKLEKQHQQQ